MNNCFNKIGLIGKYGNPHVAETVRELGMLLQKRGCEIMLEHATGQLLTSRDLPCASLDEIGRNCDLTIIVGGDGTLLAAARTLVEYDIPILGVNLGRLGFLVDISPDDMEERINEILDGNYEEEHRILLNAEVQHKDSPPSESDAFNDVVVHKWEVARMIETETWVNGRFLNSMRSDGLIVSTPTGSTAYALSGGGPIIEPGVNAILIVPICPHSMSYRPIVVSGDSEIEILVKENMHSHAQVTCDGQINLGLVSGDKILIRKKDNVVRLIHPRQHNHFEILRAKMHWGEHS
ncbi:NAD kinase [hydrothermal vent metagenome]|uniref:NAD kinase n=1 Tax=hydrothermal vent metagenome TaxID=652676 RepID=A0A3B1C907_9ZZZZ